MDTGLDSKLAELSGDIAVLIGDGVVDRSYSHRAVGVKPQSSTTSSQQLSKSFNTSSHQQRMNQQPQPRQFGGLNHSISHLQRDYIPTPTPKLTVSSNQITPSTPSSSQVVYPDAKGSKALSGYLKSLQKKLESSQTEAQDLKQINETLTKDLEIKDEAFKENEELKKNVETLSREKIKLENDVTRLDHEKENLALTLHQLQKSNQDLQINLKSEKQSSHDIQEVDQLIHIYILKDIMMVKSSMF